MPRLVLTDAEIQQIKGLIQHTDFNDQMIQSIFSHLDRTINHREIGAIRAEKKSRYVNSPASSSDDISILLRRYSKLSAYAAKLGFTPSDTHTEQIQKSIDIMKTAVLVYNNNTISTRSETFIVLSVIAWTYVLHCYYRSISIEPVYLDDTGNAQIVDGKEKLWELSHCIKHQQCPLNDGEVRNLRYIIAIRNEVEHRSCEDINQDVQAKLQATALNFIKFCDSKFGSQYNFSEDLAFTIQLTALQLSSTNALKNEATVSKAVSVVNKLFEGNLSAADYNDQSYAYRVYVIPKVTNNPKKADQAVAFASVGSELEMAIKNIERPKHLATQAIEILKTRGFPTLTSHGFTQAWKQNDLKNTGKGFAIKLGIQWFWYDEGLDKIAEMLAQQV